MVNITDKYVGAMCREFRLTKLNYTQDAVARSAGVCRATVVRFESGVSTNLNCLFWYIKQGLFDWCPIDRWEGWEL